MKLWLSISLLIPLISFGQKDRITDSIELVIAELAKPVYIETYKTVNTARFKVKNALSGKYSVKEAMDYYNENLSSYMGRYQTLQSVKKRLDTAGDAFIDAMFLREKGRIAKSFADQINAEMVELQAEESFEKKTGVKKSVKRTVDHEAEIYTKVEVDAKYPGNWCSFLERNLDLQVATYNGASPGTYTVMIQFIVDVAGNVSDVKALSSVGFGMEQEAVRVVKKSGKWNPGIQNGREVKSYHKLPITFTVK
jgi:TonB family protein